MTPREEVKPMSARGLEALIGPDAKLSEVQKTLLAYLKAVEASKTK